MSQSSIRHQADDKSTHGVRPHNRRFARANVSIPIQYTLAGADDMQGEIVNLGGGGVRFASTDDLKRGEMLTLRFCLPDASQEVIARGKVVLSFFEASTARYAHGVAFAQISGDDQQRIITYVESIQHENADL